MQIRLVNASRKIGYEMVIDNVNIQFESGHIYGLRGKNGNASNLWSDSFGGRRNMAR